MIYCQKKAYILFIEIQVFGIKRLSIYYKRNSKHFTQIPEMGGAERTGGSGGTTLMCEHDIEAGHLSNRTISRVLCMQLFLFNLAYTLDLYTKPLRNLSFSSTPRESVALPVSSQ
jgi:hypothetical protein